MGWGCYSFDLSQRYTDTTCSFSPRIIGDMLPDDGYQEVSENALGLRLTCPPKTNPPYKLVISFI